MDWLVYPLRDLLVWLFENTLEPLGNYPNTIFILIISAGLIYWLFKQHQLNKKADQPADLYVNDKLIAQGEIVVVDNTFGIKITKLA